MKEEYFIKSIRQFYWLDTQSLKFKEKSRVEYYEAEAICLNLVNENSINI